jgi:hypothetical protein
MRLVTDCVVIARRGLLLLSVVMLTGHICALPTHGHVETEPWHEDGDPRDADETVHAASCEALPSSGIACPAVLTISAFVAATSVEPLEWVGCGGTSPLPTKSPPRFLLHAALLI